MKTPLENWVWNPTHWYQAFKVRIGIKKLMSSRDEIWPKLQYACRSCWTSVRKVYL